MTYQIADRPAERLTMTELGMLQRMATQYSGMVRRHAYLVGLMSLAARMGDAHLLESTKKRLAENELECDRCFSALRVLRQELLSATAHDSEDELSAVA